MKRVVVSFFIINILISCNFTSPKVNELQTKAVDYNEKDIIGTWDLDKFSYKYLSKKNNLDSIYITFKADSTFVMNNSIDLFNKSADLSLNKMINGKLDNINIHGFWKISRYDTSNSQVLSLKYNNIQKSGFNIYKKGDEYQIWYFLNDPDTGQRLRFLKRQ
jgi:hypothetical protein